MCQKFITTKVEQMVQGYERNHESAKRKTDIWDTATEVH